MQAILLAAGNSSRLYPYGGKVHKSALTVLGKSLIVRTVEELISVGVNDIVVVDSEGNGVKDLIEKTSFSVPVRIVTHEGARGMGEALLDTKELLQKTFLLVHAHHVDVADHIQPLIGSLSEEQVTLLIKKEANLSAYGVVKLDGEIVTELVEKPVNPQEYEYRIVGMYALNEQFIDTLEKISKHHYSFEEALSSIINKRSVKAIKTENKIITFKYPFHLFDIAEYLFSKEEDRRSENCEISNSVTIEGKVIIEEGVRILENAVIKGPVYLGRNAVIGTNAIIREGVSIEESSKIGANMEVKHSIIGSRSTTHSGFLGDSIVGSDSKLAAMFCSGNVRLDRKNVTMTVKGEKISTGRTHLGTFIGNNVRVGIRVSTMPGVVIGNNSFIGPQTVVFRNVDENVSFYSKFSDVVLKETVSESADETIVNNQIVVLFDIDYTLFDTAKFKQSELTEYILYDEVFEVLDTLGSSVLLGIFSEGDLDFQKTKLVSTLIHDRFLEDHIHIVAEKHATIASILETYSDKRLVLVDDKIEVLKMAKGLAPKTFTIWIKRGPFAESADEKTFTPDATVTSLKDVIKIVSNI